MIELDLESHRYTADGVPMPSVTGILQGLNLVDASWYTSDSRTRGHHVHAAIHLHLSGGLDWGTVWEPWQGYVRAAIRFLEDAGADSSTLRTEAQVHNALLGYCGTADVFGMLFGTETVLDWKSGSLGRVTGLQTAGYDLADPLPGGRRRRRLGVVLLENGDYRSKDLTAMDALGLDYTDFQAAVRLYRAHVWEREKRHNVRSSAAYS